MPESQEIKWIRQTTPTTKAKLSTQLGVSKTHLDWAEQIFQACAENLMIFQNIFSALITMASLSAYNYYHTYYNSLLSLFETIESKGDNVEFYIEQKYKWHAGHRSWQPLSSFRVVNK